MFAPHLKATSADGKPVAEQRWDAGALDHDAATGAILWSYPSGGSCLSGAAIAGGTLYWGSGYSNFGFGTANSKLYAFTVPD